MSVRLTEHQISSIVSILNDFFVDSSAQLYLYGSRAKLHEKGGDIDLLIVLNDVKLKAGLHQKKHIILAQMKKNIGDQKIDLSFASQDELSTDPFLQVIFPSAVLLHQWNS